MIGLLSSIFAILTKFSDVIVTQTMLIIVTLIMLTGIFIYSMNNKHNEEYADEFAIKAGYGKPLERALIKLTKYYTRKDNLGKKGDIVEKAVITITKISNKLLGLYPTNRMKRIREKTEQYDTSDRNIDRTANIDYTLSNKLYESYNRMIDDIAVNTILLNEGELSY